MIPLSEAPLPVAWSGQGPSPVTAFAWTEPGGELWCLDREGNLALWSPYRREQVSRAALGTLNCAAIEPVHGWVAAGEQGGRLRLHELRTGREVWRVPAHEGPVRQVLLDPFRGRVYSAGPRTVAVHELSSGRRLACREADGTRIALNHCGSLLATSRLCLAPETLAIRESFRTGDGGMDVVFLGDDLARTAPGGTTHDIWILGKDGKARLGLTGLAEGPGRLAANPGGHVLAAWGDRVAVWDLRARRALGSCHPPGGRDGVGVMALDVRGRFLAVGVPGGFQVFRLSP
jgi:hypothetical protein